MISETPGRPVWNTYIRQGIGSTALTNVTRSCTVGAPRASQATSPAHYLSDQPGPICGMRTMGAGAGTDAFERSALLVGAVLMEEVR
jgi:hypothetical protein